MPSSQRNAAVLVLTVKFVTRSGRVTINSVAQSVVSVALVSLALSRQRTSDWDSCNRGRVKAST